MGEQIMKVSELKPKSNVDVIELEITKKGDARDFSSQRGAGTVATCEAKDKTGEVKVTLWNEQVEQIKEGDKIKIENGWVSEWQGQLQVSTGKLGSLTKL